MVYPVIQYGLLVYGSVSESKFYMFDINMNRKLESHASRKTVLNEYNFSRERRKFVSQKSFSYF